MAHDAAERESPQVDTRRVLAIVAGIIVVLTLIGFGFQPLFRDRIGQTFTVSHPFPAPEVSLSERAQRLALEAKQRRALNGARGRMPIAAAMKAIVARGPQAFDPIEGRP